MNGHLMHNAADSEFNKVRRKGVEGKIVGITVDTTEGVLSFELNGEALPGRHQDDRFKNGILFPSISMWHSGDAIQYVHHVEEVK